MRGTKVKVKKCVIQNTVNCTSTIVIQLYYSTRYENILIYRMYGTGTGMYYILIYYSLCTSASIVSLLVYIVSI